MSDFYNDPNFQGRPMLIPLDRLPDSRTADLSQTREYKISGYARVIELDGKEYMDVTRWKLEK